MIIERYKKSPRALIMCFADPSGNPRPRRAVELCISQGFDVSAVGFPLKHPFEMSSYFSIPYPSISLHHRILRKLFAVVRSSLPFEDGRLFCEEKLYGFTKVKNSLNGSQFDLLIVEDLHLLPLAFAIKGEAKILFDAREYYPRQNEGEIFFNLFEKKRREQLCRDYMPRCDAVVTVSEGLRREYLKEFGVSAELYRSTPPYADLPVHPVNPNQIRMVYHGAANRNRRLENLIEVVALLDKRFSLDLILVGSPSYQRELRNKAASVKNVKFREPVPFNDILPTICWYDIGFFYYEPTGFNILHSLPNKFFEYIQARLMLAIGPSPDMADLVKAYGCGVVADSFSVNEMARILNSLTASDVNRFKVQSDRAARDLCFEEEKKVLLCVIDKIMNQ